MEMETTQSKYKNLVRVPRLYKIAAGILQKVENQEESLKSAIFAAKHPNKKALTALVTTTLQRGEDIEYVMRKAKILENESSLENRGPLVKILIAELIWGKKRLGGDAMPIQTVLKYQEKMEKAYEKYMRKSSRRPEDDHIGKKVAMEKPRYVRVNTLKISLEDAVEYLVKEGWNELAMGSVNDLTTDDFCRDEIVENLLVFAPKVTFHKHPLYLDGSFILQDKASCLSALALKPRIGRSVLDACAAPGMKTTLIAGLVGKSSKIIAVEKSEKRCQVLRDMLSNCGCDFVEVLNQDFTEIDPTTHEEIEYILVDPSCSGSGMYGRFDVPYNKGSEHDRLHSLSYYQKKVLCHAMKFPNVKRIVYSTCSINPEENEDVIQSCLEFADNHRRFRLKKALPNWSHRLQNPKYEWSELCVKCDFETDKTDGFFIAALERIGGRKR